MRRGSLPNLQFSASSFDVLTFWRASEMPRATITATEHFYWMFAGLSPQLLQQLPPLRSDRLRVCAHENSLDQIVNGAGWPVWRGGGERRASTLCSNSEEGQPAPVFR